jgi:oligopeptide transport system ATP-binding protein
MLQRCVIAAALAVEPELVIADEPTTALDVTTQSEVMAILGALRHELRMAMLFITHDLDLTAAVCDRTQVMYAGEIVEEQASAALHEQPQHPYTAGLAGARPRVDVDVERLRTIPGRPTAAFERPPGCPFAPRCPYSRPRCRQQHPPLRSTARGLVACVRFEEIGDELMHAPLHEAVS